MVACSSSLDFVICYYWFTYVEYVNIFKCIKNKYLIHIMNYLFFIVCSIILSPFSAIEIKPKLCIDCKFFLKDSFTSNKYGKCLLFTREDNDSFLVDGIKKENEHTFCSVARKYENMCGKEGKFYTPFHLSNTDNI